MRRRRGRSDEAPMSFFSFQDIIACTTGIMVLITLMLTLELLTRHWDVNAPAPLPANLKEDIAKAEKQREALQARFIENEETLNELSMGTPITKRQMEVLAQDVKRRKDENTERNQQIVKAGKSLDTVKNKADQIEKKLTVKKKNVVELKNHVTELRKQLPVTVIDRHHDGRRPLWIECSAAEIVVSEILAKGKHSGAVRELKRFTGPNSGMEFLGWAKPGQVCNPGADTFVLLVRPDAVGEYKLVCTGLRRYGYRVGTDVWLKGRRLTENGGKEVVGS